MIRKHEFNSRWWGHPVGFVYDPAFFSLDAEKQQGLLEPFAWAEFHTPMERAPSLNKMNGARFFQTDTQLQFLLNLFKVEPIASIEKLEARFADRDEFEINTECLASFEHERFQHVPGCSQRKINERYALWANDLVREQPQTCLQMFHNGKLQGWFLSRPEKGNRLNLTLAMLSNKAEISGMLLYQKACLAFAKRGYRLGSAGFSVTNTQVHNIYAKLGARFVAPIGNWMWIAQTKGKQADD